MRRLQVTAAVLLAAATVGVGCRKSAPPPAVAARPDILFISVDTLRADHTSVYGYHRPTTPALEALARDGVKVEHAYAPMATTGPSHATMLTGLYPLAHGVRQNGHLLDERFATLQERLKEAGYTTGAVVSTFVLKGQFGFKQGFDTFEEGFDAATASLSRERGDPGEPRPAREPRDRRASATTDLALRWLSQRPKDQPWFLWVHYYDPHDPYWAAENHARFAENGLTGHGARIALYDGEIAYADEHIGRLLDALDTSRTLVAMTADHGEGLWQHGHKGHGIHLYEEAVRVPLIFRWTGRVAKGAVVPGPVELVDLAPTVLDLAGVPWSGEKAHGQSLAPALRGERRVAGWDEKRPVFLQRRSYDAATTHDGDIKVAGSKLAIRQGRFKYIEAPQEGTRELYDLLADPKERENLMTRMAPEADRLAQLLERWRAHYDKGVTAREDRSAETEEALRALGYVR